ncbi:hypothetical protein QYM36_009196 [Artemia franciscana]|uniref:Uncharacterized protein n=1 Tax=Artemia franciscana TaxID=6661 RepID=A0AA88HSK5_ARTSF|nr:hypothetical protein QYM36_009196 [Artemia franciscana]
MDVYEMNVEAVMENLSLDNDLPKSMSCGKTNGSGSECKDSGVFCSEELADSVLGEDAQGKVFVALRRRDSKKVAGIFIKDKSSYLRKLKKGELVSDEICVLDKVKRMSTDV